MSARTLSHEITQSPEGMRVWQQERAIFEITERICDLMAQQGISRAELARRLQTTAPYVTQILDGSANMTIRKMSDVYLALGREFHATDTPISVANDDVSGELRIVYPITEYRATRAIASSSGTVTRPMSACM